MLLCCHVLRSMYVPEIGVWRFPSLPDRTENQSTNRSINGRVTLYTKIKPKHSLTASTLRLQQSLTVVSQSVSQQCCASRRDPPRPWPCHKRQIGQITRYPQNFFFDLGKLPIAAQVHIQQQMYSTCTYCTVDVEFSATLIIIIIIIFRTTLPVIICFALRVHSTVHTFILPWHHVHQQVLPAWTWTWTWIWMIGQDRLVIILYRLTTK